LAGKDIQFRTKHRRYTVEHCAALGINGVDNKTGVELLGREHYGAATCEGAEEAHHKAKAVEQRWRAADDIFIRESQSVAEESGVVDDVTVEEVISAFTSRPAVEWVCLTHGRAWPLSGRLWCLCMVLDILASLKASNIAVGIPEVN
jgi:hypothetical protein